MMIDKRYQGKGYGKLAFEKMLMDIERMPYGEAKYVTLFYHTSHDKGKSIIRFLWFCRYRHHSGSFHVGD